MPPPLRHLPGRHPGRPARPTGLLLATLLFAWLCAERAHAYEDQLSLGLGLGYANTPIGDRPHHGLLSGLTLGVGLDDVFTLRARLDYSVHPDGDATLHRGIFGIEFLYLVDVLSWVPYFGLGLDGLAWFGAGDPEPDAGVHAIVGMDYLWSRELIFGAELRGLWVGRALEDDPVQLLALLSATCLFDLW